MAQPGRRPHSEGQALPNQRAAGGRLVHVPRRSCRRMRDGWPRSVPRTAPISGAQRGVEVAHLVVVMSSGCCLVSRAGRARTTRHHPAARSWPRRPESPGTGALEKTSGRLPPRLMTGCTGILVRPEHPLTVDRLERRLRGRKSFGFISGSRDPCPPAGSASRRFTHRPRQRRTTAGTTRPARSWAVTTRGLSSDWCQMPDAR